MLTLRAVIDLGKVLKAIGKITLAEPYYRRALEGYERTLGSDHMLTLTAIGNMGNLLQDQGKLREAKPFFRSALEGYERTMGAIICSRSQRSSTLACC